MLVEFRCFRMRLLTVICSRLFLLTIILVLLLTIAGLLGTSFDAPYSAETAPGPVADGAGWIQPDLVPSTGTAAPDTPSWPKHTLAVVVPFRDRFEEMLVFVPHLHKFLNAQRVKHHIFIVNQVDLYRFNRASLINVGYQHARNTCDYMVMHDVDLLPLNPNLSYAFPGDGLFHVAAPEYHPRYHYDKFVGGILIATMKHFGLLNGLSNNYWGWGLEDDEFYTRIAAAKLPIRRPTNLTTDTKNTFRHVHDRRVRRRDMETCFNQREVTHKRDRQTGADSVQYRLLKLNRLSIDGAPVSLLNVRLQCDTQRTPWCDCSGQAAAAKSTSSEAPPAAQKLPPPVPKTSQGRQIRQPVAIL